MSLFAARRRPAVPGCALGRLTVVVAAAVLTSACIVTPPAPASLHGGPAVAVREFSFEHDTFAFANDIRAFSPDRDDLYANYCFVLAKGMRQFFLFARFDPAATRLDHAGYAERVRQVVVRPPWHGAIPPDDRVVIPGYANLREFSRAEESAVKDGMGGRFWTFVHWTNWRVGLPVSRAHQAQVLEEIRGDLAAGRLVQLLVTNWPTPELNHTVVAFASRVNGAGVDVAVWDPNEPARPGTITFDMTQGHFWATKVYATRPGVIRVFRMYYSGLL